jgi:hypothetical protein
MAFSPDCEVVRRQHKAISTEACYIFWLCRYMTVWRGMPQGLSSDKKLEQFLTDLARHRNVSGQRPHGEPFCACV